MAVESYQTCRTGRTGLTTKKLTTTENGQRKTDNEKPTTETRQQKLLIFCSTNK